MRRMPVKDVYINDIQVAIPFRDDDEKIKITKDLESKKFKLGIRNIRANDIDERGGYISYSQKQEAGAFH